MTMGNQVRAVRMITRHARRGIGLSCKVATFLIVALTFPSWTWAQQATWVIPSNEEIRALLAKRMENNGVGVVVGVIEPAGRRIIPYGKSGTPEGRPLDGDTLFMIGSVAKTFVGLVLADMVVKGEVKLDDPAAKYLPAGLKMPQRGRPITLVDLQLNVSGLPRMPTNFNIHGEPNPIEAYTVTDLFQFLSTYTPAREPGVSFEYSNLGVSILGRVLGLRAGKEYEDLVKERVLLPLGMKSTSIRLSPEQIGRLAPGHAKDLLPVHSPEMKTLSASGSLRSSANDLLNFLEANLGYRETGLQQAIQLQLRVPTFPATQGPQVPGAPQEGLGWRFRESMGRTINYHDGDKDGYRAAIAVDRESRTGVVVLSNALTEDPPQALARYLLTGEPMAPAPPAMPLGKFVHVDAKLMELYEGEYRFADSNVFRVARHGDHLYIDNVGRGSPEPYFAEGPRDFRMRAEKPEVSFRIDAAGNVTSLIYYPRGRQVSNPPSFEAKLVER